MKKNVTYNGAFSVLEFARKFMVRDRTLMLQVEYYQLNQRYSLGQDK